jgi:hypothetical protein
MTRTVALAAALLLTPFVAAAEIPGTCPAGEKAKTFSANGQTWNGCVPERKGGFCAEGRVFVYSPGNGQSACSAIREVGWYCPAGEQPFNFFFEASKKLETLCKPARANGLCAAGRVYVKSPATGQSGCLAVKDASWYCPAGEQPRNFFFSATNKVETVCEPVRNDALCAKGRVFVKSPATGHAACTELKGASWACPAGEQPFNWVNRGSRVTACTPLPGRSACASGRRLIRTAGAPLPNCAG